MTSVRCELIITLSFPRCWFIPMASLFLQNALALSAVFGALLAFASGGAPPVNAQAPPLNLNCAYVEMGQGLYAEPSMHCFDLQYACPAGHPWGCFKRELVFEEGFVQSPGEPDRRVTAQAFGYVDRSKMHWDVPVGYPTDGASIPERSSLSSPAAGPSNMFPRRFCMTFTSGVSRARRRRCTACSFMRCSPRAWHLTAPS